MTWLGWYKWNIDQLCVSNLLRRLSIDAGIGLILLEVSWSSMVATTAASSTKHKQWGKQPKGIHALTVSIVVLGWKRMGSGRKLETDLRKCVKIWRELQFCLILVWNGEYILALLCGSLQYKSVNLVAYIPTKKWPGWSELPAWPTYFWLRNIV